ncbi:MAG: hypothetical protein ABJB12_14120 [Pseudomonadota bacterium]
MRLLFMPLCLLVAGSVRVCSNEEKSNAGVAVSAEASARAKGASVASAEAQAAVPRPRIGGSVATAGDLSVELALHEGGRIEALVNDASGRLVSGVKVSALVQAKGGASQNVELGLVAARSRFEGQTKAGVELAPGPVTVALEIGGKVRECKLAVGVIVPQPKIGGHVLAAGNFSAEVLVHRGGEIQALLRDTAGVEVNGEAGLELVARCKAKGGATEEIALRFDAPHACFAGQAKAGVELEPGPLEFVIEGKAGGGVGGLEHLALTVDASHGGQLIALGDYSVELVAKGNQVSAFAFDAAGRAQTAGDLDLKLGIGAGGASLLALGWDAPCLCYKANVAADLKLALQPIRVSLVAAGKAFFGGVGSLQAAAKANLHADAKLDTPTLDANGKLGAASKLAAGATVKLDPKLDAKASAGLAKGASAAVKVTPPKVSLSTNSGATGGTKAGAGAKASAGFSFGTK